MKAPVGQRTHESVLGIPEAPTGATKRMLGSFAAGDHPVRTPVAALPLDPEDLSEEAARAVEEALADRRAGRTHTSDEVKKELGI